MEPVSLYFHIPFCRSRCAYCDFTTAAGCDALIPAYLDALLSEIRGVKEAAGRLLPAHTVYFGGGTPSLIPLEGYNRLFEAIREAFELTVDAEITLEANPGTVDGDYLRGLRQAGFNRISFGMQSAWPEELALLGRRHSHLEVIRAVNQARTAGFEQVSLDLIYGLPGQGLDSWRFSVERALELNPDHLSLYSLTVEPGTPLAAWVGRGLLPEPDADQAARMYTWARARLARAGMAQYEISNWGRRLSRGKITLCRHNRHYWRREPYFGFGAGAHGFLEGWRVSNTPDTAAYIRRCGEKKRESLAFSPACETRLKLDARTEMEEVMFLGLRLTREGVSEARFLAQTGRELRQVYGREIDELVKWGMLTWKGRRLVLTARGQRLGNQVFLRFLHDQ